MKNKIGTILCVLLIPAPLIVKRFFYNRLFGWTVSKSAKIGMSYINVKNLVVGEGSRIGSFNVIRNLELLELGQNVSILNGNWVNAIPLGSTIHFADETDRFPALIIGDESAVGKKNFFDCNNTIRIGKFSAIAGSNNYFSTHGVNLQYCKQESDTITIGDYCRIATHSVVLKGCKLPTGSTLAANSTLHKAFEDEYTLYSGVPAKAIKEFDPSWAFFHREKGFVD